MKFSILMTVLLVALSAGAAKADPFIENSGEGDIVNPELQIQGDVDASIDNSNSTTDNDSYCVGANCSGAAANGNTLDSTIESKNQNNNDNFAAGGAASSDNNSNISQTANTSGGNVTGGSLNQGPQTGGAFSQEQQGGDFRQENRGTQSLEQKQGQGQGQAQGQNQSLDQSNSGNVKGGSSSSEVNTGVGVGVNAGADVENNSRNTNVSGSGSVSGSQSGDSITSSGSGSASSSGATSNSGNVNPTANAGGGGGGGGASSAATGGRGGNSTSYGGNTTVNSNNREALPWNQIPNSVFRPFERGGFNVQGGVRSNGGEDEFYVQGGLNIPLGGTSRTLRRQVEAEIAVTEAEAFTKLAEICVPLLEAGYTAPQCDGFKKAVAEGEVTQDITPHAEANRDIIYRVPQVQTNIIPDPAPEVVVPVEDASSGTPGINPNPPEGTPIRGMW